MTPSPTLAGHRRAVASTLDDRGALVQPSDRLAAANTLALAFRSDPVHRWLFPGGWEWRRASQSFWNALLRRADRHGIALGVDGLRAVSVWFPPEPTRDSGRALLRFNLEMTRIAAWRAMRLARLASLLEERLPRGPFWYLAIVGVDPGARGQGLGRRAIGPVLSVADEQGVGSYLESSNPDNVPLYEHFGFRVTGEIRVRGGPTLWAMWRPGRG